MENKYFCPVCNNEYTKKIDFCENEDCGWEFKYFLSNPSEEMLLKEKKRLEISKRKLEKMEHLLEVDSIKNTAYEIMEDTIRFDNYNLSSVVNEQTIIIIVGASILPELLDRPTAQKLRNILLNKGKNVLILTDIWYYKEEHINLKNNVIITIGSEGVNLFTKNLVEDYNKNKDNYYYKNYENIKTKITKKSYDTVALYGWNEIETESIVFEFINNDLDSLLNSTWK